MTDSTKLNVGTLGLTREQMDEIQVFGNALVTTPFGVRYARVYCTLSDVFDAEQRGDSSVPPEALRIVPGDE